MNGVHGDMNEVAESSSDGGLGDGVVGRQVGDDGLCVSPVTDIQQSLEQSELLVQLSL